MVAPPEGPFVAAWLISALPLKGGNSSGRKTSSSRQPAAPRIRPCGMDTIIGTDQTRDAKQPGRWRISRTRIRVPPFRTGVGMSVEGSDDHGTRDNGGLGQVQ